MTEITLIATATFGLEAVVKRELTALGFNDLKTTNGRVEFPAVLADIPRTNLWLRSADRVLVKVGEFTAVTFDDLFEATVALPWERWIPADGRFPVLGKSIKSSLHNAPACQAIVKKAVVERLKKGHGVTALPETGAAFTIQVSLRQNRALLTLDTSGEGLHKRGYRAEGGQAPLKETLAAGLVQLSYWNRERYLLDPMCGSGTILIEAALIGHHIAPGLARPFAAEQWPILTPAAWKQARQEARDAITRQPLQLSGSDNDTDVIALAKRNAEKADVAGAITFTNKPIRDVWIDRQYGILITNPPYGMRLANFGDINQIYRTLNQMIRKKSGWSVYVLTADKQFPRFFKRGRPDRVRKLYNGAIEVNYYQFYGKKPGKN